MKHLWFSVGVLTVMVLVLNWNGSHLVELSNPLCEEISLASQAARVGEWENAAQHTANAQTQWEENTGYLRFVQCHANLEKVSVLFEESKAFLACQETGSYLAINAQLLGAIKELSELENLTAGNLF